MSNSSFDIIKSPPKALAFDIFGTTVNWRKTTTETLIHSAHAKTSSSSRSADLSPELRRKLFELTDESWAHFAQEWRNSYKTFVKNYNLEKDEWRDIDTHHLLSLQDLLTKWGLTGLYDENEVEDLSKVWHFLDPWADSAVGVQQLRKKFVSSTLSNGNQSLLKDLNKHGNLRFDKIQSSADFGAYKPDPRTYLGAAKTLGVQPNEVAMVACHLADLEGARSNGLRTIYVERPSEEDWSPEEDDYKDAKTWVDMWVSSNEDGFREVARRFGIQ